MFRFTRQRMYDFGVNTLGQQWIWGQVNQVETVRARQTKIMALGTAHGTSYTVPPPTRAEAFSARAKVWRRTYAWSPKSGHGSGSEGPRHRTRTRGCCYAGFRDRRRGSTQNQQLFFRYLDTRGRESESRKVRVLSFEPSPSF